MNHTNQFLIRSIGLFFALMLINGHILRGQEVIHLISVPASPDMIWQGGEQNGISNWDQMAIVSNVSQPSLTVYLPAAEKSNGMAMIIAPGGGFHLLSIDNEGKHLAEWCVRNGIAAFVLKYRLVPTGTDPAKEFQEKIQKGPEHMEKTMGPYIGLAKADGLAAISYVRENATRFGVDPNKIGIIGFSAGGTVAAAAGYEYTSEKDRPDFIAPIYAALHVVNMQQLPPDPMPVFLAATGDDFFGFQSQSLDLYRSWNNAKLPMELHVYEKGGHGFGLKKQNLPSDYWIDTFHHWLKSISFR